jgi:D-alanyl-D-alanine carboxypeptidase-like protein
VRGCALFLFITLAFSFPGIADADAVKGDGTGLDALVRAYPDELSGYDSTDLIWRDGTRMPVSDGLPNKSFAEMLRHASILDQISQRYPAGVGAAALVPPGDPGRVRNRAFFDKMYGDCWRGEVRGHLVPVVWLPRSWGRSVRVTSVNGIAAGLGEISAELDALPAHVKRYLYPSAGTYNCRTVADTGEPSMHSWGAAIDINAAYAEYWLWPRAAPANSLPVEIIEIFERHGFIWGGKWSHYDTMHFEYRPELLDPSPVQHLSRRP